MSLNLYSNDGLYGTLDYGGPYIAKGLAHSQWIGKGMPRQAKVLNVGAGNSYEAVLLRKSGFESTYVLDIYIPKIEYLRGHQIQAWAQEMPFGDKVFDLIICCETMEHIPEELTDAVLSECKRVAREVYFTIATRDDPPFHAHICIHTPAWWIEKFMELGFKIINAQMNPWLWVQTENKITLLRYDDGVSIYAKTD